MQIMKKLLIVFSLLGLFGISACSNDDDVDLTPTPGNVSSSLQSGTWRITYYWDSDHEETSSFTGYNFTFGSSNIVTAVKTGTTVPGTWTTGYDDSKVKLYLDFVSPADFVEISDDWHVLERTDIKIRMEDVSGGGSGTDYLTFEKN